MKIIIKGQASTDYQDLKKLDGIDCQDDFVEYMDESLKSKLKYGYLSFKYENNNLYSIVEYESKEKLSDKELEELKDYTSGQLSDGIGEGFEQTPCYFDDDDEIYISPWYFGQILEVYQYE